MAGARVAGAVITSMHEGDDAVAIEVSAFDPPSPDLQAGPRY
jgi:hypothetical protein